MNRITVALEHVRGRHSDHSINLRTYMNVESLSWPSFNWSENNPSKSDLLDDEQKIWTSCGPEILGRKLWYGKPGKDIRNYKDMRPRIWLNSGVPPQNPHTTMLSFREIVEPLHEIMRLLDEEERKEIWCLLTRMIRPSTELDHRVITDTSANKMVFWSPNEEIMDRIRFLNEKIGLVNGFELIDYLLITEGIARNEDLRYFRVGDKNVGRPNTIRTLMYMIYLRLINDEILSPPVQELWNVLMIRIGIKAMPIAQIIKLTQE